MAGEGIDRMAIGFGQEPRRNKDLLTLVAERLHRNAGHVQPEARDPLEGSPAADLVLEANQRARNQADD